MSTFWREYRDAMQKIAKETGLSIEQVLQVIRRYEEAQKEYELDHSRRVKTSGG